MVVVVPSFAEGEDADNPIISTLIVGPEWLASP